MLIKKCSPIQSLIDSSVDWTIIEIAIKLVFAVAGNFKPRDDHNEKPLYDWIPRLQKTCLCHYC